MSSEPLVSICIITYNSAEYVLETLESAKAQTYQNIELIVSDDCSTDNTVEICRGWIEKNRIRFVRTELITVEKNTGIPANCNRGFKAANGEWIKGIAGDDILLDNCIEAYLCFINQNSTIRFVTANMQTINQYGKTISSKSHYSLPGLMKYYLSKDAKEQLKLYARFPAFVNSPAFFIRKDLLVEIGYSDEEFRIFEDTCLVLKVNENGYKVYYLNRSTVKYRITETSVSLTPDKSINDKRAYERWKIFEKYRKKHLSKTNMVDLLVYYDVWLTVYYKGIMGYKGLRILQKTSPFYWYYRYINYSYRNVTL